MECSGPTGLPWRQESASPGEIMEHPRDQLLLHLHFWVSPVNGVPQSTSHRLRTQLRYGYTRTTHSDSSMQQSWEAPGQTVVLRAFPGLAPASPELCKMSSTFLSDIPAQKFKKADNRCPGTSSRWCYHMCRPRLREAAHASLAGRKHQVLLPRTLFAS